MLDSHDDKLQALGKRLANVRRLHSSGNQPISYMKPRYFGKRIKGNVIRGLNADYNRLSGMTHGGFYRAIQEAKKQYTLAVKALNFGSRFVDVNKIDLVIGRPYFIRRVWYNPTKGYKTKLDIAENPCLAKWGINGWEMINGNIATASGYAGIEVWG